MSASDFAAAPGTCDQYPSDDYKPPSDNGIPEPEDSAVPPEPCKENEYFDRQLGYCVPLMADCCPIGQDYSPDYDACVDVATKPRDGECAEGFELIDGMCWLIGRTEGRGGLCWLITRNTPQCVGPCEVGLIYNELTGRCEEPYTPEEPAQPEPSDPCANVSCGRYNDPKSCSSNNCCTWLQGDTGAGQCVKR